MSLELPPLHNPDRIDDLRDVEEHLASAANYTRALWKIIVSADGHCSLDDERTAEALRELADAAADHASAARYAFAAACKASNI